MIGKSEEKDAFLKRSANCSQDRNTEYYQTDEREILKV